MGTQNNVVGTIFLCLFKNVIHKADNSDRVNVDSGGSKRIRKRLQPRLQFGDAFRSLSNISMKDKFTERGDPVVADLHRTNYGCRISELNVG
jgi:hypothetical protein